MKESYWKGMETEEEKVKKLQETLKKKIARVDELEKALLSEPKEAEQRGKSPFKRFIQLDKSNIRHIISACNPTDANSLKLFFFMMSYMDSYNRLVCPYEVFQQKLGMSKSTVARCIKFLKEKNLIDVQKKGTANMYVISPHMVWSSKGTLYQSCPFPADKFPCVCEDTLEDHSKDEENAKKKRKKTKLAINRYATLELKNDTKPTKKTDSDEE